MHEVSCRATRILIEGLENAGIDARDAVRGLGLPLDHLTDSSRRIDWDDLSRFMDRIAEACAGVMSPEEFGERLVAVPSYEFLRRAGQILVSPAQLYWVAERWMAPAMFPVVVVRTRWLQPDRLLVTGDLLPGRRPSEAFFRICHGNVVALPRVLDLPKCEVIEQTVTGTSGRIVVAPPASHTLAARVVRGARAVGRFRAVVSSFARQQSALGESLAALQASRQEFQELLERLPIGVVVHREGIVVWANAAMMESLGRTREETVGQPILAFVAEEDRAALRERMAPASGRRIPAVGGEYRVARPDGSLRWLEAGAAQHVDFAGGAARLELMRDVTDERRLKEQLVVADRLASIGTLAAGVAHEINNPLAYVQTSLDVGMREIGGLGRGADARVERVAAALELARTGVSRVLGIVRDLNALARSDIDPLETIDVRSAIDSTLALASKAMAQRARVVCRFGPVPAVRATGGRLGQVILNLCLNAADAIAPGAPARNEIVVSTSTDPSGRAVIEVADSGEGIAAEIAPRVFEPFVTTKPVGAGTGLGLAICHRIVTELHGEISFESRPDGGTIFRVVLPPARGAPSRFGVAAPSATTSTREPRRRRPRVLVVDDEPELVRALSALLGDAHDVVSATSGIDAVEMLRRDSAFDVVLADLMMAGVTGMDLYDRVSELAPGLERRMLFMTGGAFTERGRKFLRSIPNRCIEKPFGVDELLEALDACREA